MSNGTVHQFCPPGLIETGIWPFRPMLTSVARPLRGRRPLRGQPAHTNNCRRQASHCRTHGLYATGVDAWGEWFLYGRGFRPGRVRIAENSIKNFIGEATVSPQTYAEELPPTGSNACIIHSNFNHTSRPHFHPSISYYPGTYSGPPIFLTPPVVRNVVANPAKTKPETKQNF